MSCPVCNNKKVALSVLATAAACGCGYLLYKKYCKNCKKEECEKPVVEESKPNVIFLLGGPGSGIRYGPLWGDLSILGKGTQSKFLEARYHWIPISAGDCLREEQATDSKDAELIKDYIKNGLIVPGHITINLLWKKIQKYAAEGKKNIIVDGFPRSMENLDGWNEIIGDKVNLLFILLLECSEEVMTERIMNRGKTSGRSDDNPEALLKRFKTHNETSKPVIELFDQKGMVKHINADQTIEAVSNDIATIFDEIQC